MSALVFGMITTDRSKAYTWYCLESFYRHTPREVSREFYLIDNDHSSTPVPSPEIPNLHLIRNETPKSFARNANILLELARERKADLVLLNNDIIFSPNWLDPLLSVTNGIVCSVSNQHFAYHHNGFQLRLTMKLEEYLENISTFEQICALHAAKRFGFKLVHSFPYFCVKIPYLVYEKVGLFDEGYGRACWEDTDYTLRCGLQRIPLYFALDSFVLHFYGKSTWSVDQGQGTVDENHAENDRAEKLFSERWGAELTELYGKQSPQSLSWLAREEEKARIQLFASIIEAKRTPLLRETK